MDREPEDMRRRPSASLITAARAGGPFVRIGHWMGRGFAEIGERFDLVLVDGEQAEEDLDGLVRTIDLGCGRASRATRSLAAYLKESRPRVVLATPGYVSPFALFAGRRARTPVIPWEAGYLRREISELPARMRLAPLLQRLTYRWSPVLAAVSESVASDLRARARPASRGSVVVVPNPIDAGEVRRGISETRADNGSVRMVAIGSLRRHKGFDVLIAALARARAELPSDWELSILGEGPARAQLESQIRELGLGGQVRLLGHIDDPYEHLGRATLFVQPSRFEGFGVAVLEALAAGVPVVATVSGGPEEILDNGRFGLLVGPDDPAGLAAGIVTMCKDEELRDTFVARSRQALQRYEPARIARRVLELAKGPSIAADPHLS